MAIYKGTGQNRKKIAENNVQSDWNEENINSSAFIKNKPESFDMSDYAKLIEGNEEFINQFDEWSYFPANTTFSLNNTKDDIILSWTIDIIDNNWVNQYAGSFNIIVKNQTIQYSWDSGLNNISSQLVVQMNTYFKLGNEFKIIKNMNNLGDIFHIIQEAFPNYFIMYSGINGGFNKKPFLKRTISQKTFEDSISDVIEFDKDYNNLKNKPNIPRVGNVDNLNGYIHYDSWSGINFNNVYSDYPNGNTGDGRFNIIYIINSGKGGTGCPTDINGSYIRNMWLITAQGSGGNNFGFNQKLIGSMNDNNPYTWERTSPTGSWVRSTNNIDVETFSNGIRFKKDGSYAYSMCFGAVNIESMAANTTKTVTVNFPFTFNYAPQVLTGVVFGTPNTAFSSTNTSTTTSVPINGFRTSAGNLYVRWVATGI